MSGKRAPSAPPEIPGFEYHGHLGSGGFADVFLYQDVLGRRVAVKVLLVDRLTSGSAEEFTAEANVMAALSAHPSIVTIYQAGVSADGRPYLVMEYFPKANLQVRYRKERFGVAEALRVGIQIAGAVQASHLAGILHRDIKPANILVSEYNRPALTDFGISATQGGNQLPVGMSIPWSPPESFASPPLCVPQSDVYALAATIYTLLAGRSPFEIPGASNTSSDILDRLEHSRLPRLGRQDVPLLLEDTLEKAMSKRPDDRHDSALSFARALQRVQVELSMSVTVLDIAEELGDSPHDDDDDEGLTRIRSVVSINPQGPPVEHVPDHELARRDPSTRRTFLQAETIAAGSGRGTAMNPPLLPAEDTVLRPVLTVAETEATETAKRHRKLVPVVISVAAFLALGGGAAATIAAIGTPEPERTSAPRTAAPVDAIVESTVPAPTGLAASATGSDVVFTWKNPSPQAGDVYLWKVSEVGSEGNLASTDKETITLQRSQSQAKTCVEVSIRRKSGKSSDQPAIACVP